MKKLTREQIKDLEEKKLYFKVDLPIESWSDYTSCKIHYIWQGETDFAFFYKDRFLGYADLYEFDIPLKNYSLKNQLKAYFEGLLEIPDFFYDTVRIIKEVEYE